MKRIRIIGMGPGKEEGMTIEAIKAIEDSDVIVGYTLYLDLLSEKYKNKEMISTPMKQEEKRCILAFEKAMEEKDVAFVCSGDAGVYGMASLIYEMGKDYPDVEIEVIPGVTAALSGAAMLGAPINHDLCIISLSDLLTPWETIEKRLKSAAEGDFNIVLYNPSSHKRKDYLKKACDILLEIKSEDTACGYVKNIGREGSVKKVCTLMELRDEEVDMFTTVFIGNSSTKIMGEMLVTPRGYKREV